MHPSKDLHQDNRMITTRTTTGLRLANLEPARLMVTYRSIGWCARLLVAAFCAGVGLVPLLVPALYTPRRCWAI